MLSSQTLLGEGTLLKATEPVNERQTLNSDPIHSEAQALSATTNWECWILRATRGVVGETGGDIKWRLKTPSRNRARLTLISPQPEVPTALSEVTFT